MNNNHLIIPPYNLKSLRKRFTINFLRALKRVNSNDNNNNNLLIKKRYKKVKFAADETLALTVGPRRAWARSILERRRRHERRRTRIDKINEARGVHAPNGSVGQAEELRRLVPGGEEMDDIQSLLNETLHYVMCLNTQVNVMRNIVDLCSTSS